MINITCEKCGQCYRVSDEYSGKKIRCSQCGSINLVTLVHEIAMDINLGVPYATDGVTPDFNALFMELLKQEREAPTLELAHR
jgi:uncharacterized Zn finger protein